MNATNSSIEVVFRVMNITDPTDFFVNVNHELYGGSLYFILLLTLWVIVFISMQYSDSDFVRNIMYSGAIVTVVSFVLRAINMTRDGVVMGLLNDWQMWIFPIVTLLAALYYWQTKQ